MTDDELLDAVVNLPSRSGYIKILTAVVKIIIEPDGHLLVSKALLKQAIEKELW